MQNNGAYGEIIDLVPYLRMITREMKEPDNVQDLLGALKKEFGLVEVDG